MYNSVIFDIEFSLLLFTVSDVELTLTTWIQRVACGPALREERTFPCEGQSHTGGRERCGRLSWES